jgi:endo-1,4-beta-mannosidase
MANRELTCSSMKAVSLAVKRRSWAWILLIPLGLAAASGAAERSEMELIVTAPDGQGFIERDSRRPYIVFGTNYYDPHTGWAPKLWRQFDAEKVRRHFEVMSDVGVNCARVFLTAGSFQPEAETIEEEALVKLDTLVKIARETGIRLMLTGPDHWEGVPSYWKPDRFAGDVALGALERFWEVVGGRYKGEPAIFAWDLLNEPHMPWSVKEWRPRWNGWLQKTYGDRDTLEADWGDELTEGDRWGEVAVAKDQADVNNPRLRDWQHFREYLADEWVRRQVEALRRADPTHLVTVGYIQWSYPLVRPGAPGLYAAFNPHRQVRWLDFVTIHFYPIISGPFDSRESWDKNLAYLQAVLAYCHTGKPVVLGEYGWYGGGAPQQHPYLSEAQQAQWLSAEIEASRPLAAGWLSWPFADTPTSGDVSLFAGLVKSDLTLKAWGREFQTYAANLPELRQPTPKLPGFDFPKALTADNEALDRMHRGYAEAVQKAIGATAIARPVNESENAQQRK